MNNILYTKTFAQWAPETTKEYVEVLEVRDVKLELILKMSYFRSWVHRDWKAAGIHVLVALEGG